MTVQKHVSLESIVNKLLQMIINALYAQHIAEIALMLVVLLVNRITI